ncbi:hypothetical protein V6N12_037962 [Hibiscus sabdariffa]|uniref:Uncharacterized protein n=1 Tax=Hibiscus sabdariffa TaxID=183260 RepID=A0ABR2BD74_9ROSI
MPILSQPLNYAELMVHMFAVWKNAAFLNSSKHITQLVVSTDYVMVLVARRDRLPDHLMAGFQDLHCFLPDDLLAACFRDLGS